MAAYNVLLSNLQASYAASTVVDGDTFFLKPGTTFIGTCPTDSTSSLCFTEAVNLVSKDPVALSLGCSSPHLTQLGLAFVMKLDV